MPWLPMLFVGRGIQKELRPDQQPKHRTFSPDPEVSARSDPTHCRREGPNAVEASRNRGPSDVRGLLTADEAATKTKRVNWRACDEGLHYWTGREDL